MIRHLRGCRTPALAVLALAALLYLPAAGRAETLYFQNKTAIPIVIQASIVVGQMVRNDRPVLLQPNGKGRVMLPGNKILTIRDARAPNRILLQITIPAGKVDLYFLVVPNPPLARVKLQRTQPFLMGPR
jgi:hypothetical protein